MTSSQFPVLRSQLKLLEFSCPENFHPCPSVKIRGRFAFVLTES